MKAFSAYVASIAALWVGVAVQAQVAHLVLDSERGDWIGQGQMWDIVYDIDQGATLAVSVLTDGEGAPDGVTFVLNANGAENTFSTVAFSTEGLGPFEPGLYLDAQRWPFQDPGHPGLDITFQNRGSNTLTGWFEVNSVMFSEDNELLSLSVDFEQHSEGAEPALFGTFTYVIPAPATLLPLAGFTLMTRRRRRPT